MLQCYLERKLKLKLEETETETRVHITIYWVGSHLEKICFWREKAIVSRMLSCFLSFFFFFFFFFCCLSLKGLYNQWLGECFCLRAGYVGYAEAVLLLVFICFLGNDIK